MTDVRLKHADDAEPHTVFSLGGVPSDDILAADLVDSARELQPELREQYRGLWGRLRAENAPLRVLTAEGFMSAPVTYFDEMLLSHVTTQWDSAEVPVIETTVHFAEIGLWQAEMLFLEARLGALVNAGQIEMRGDPADPRTCEIRLC